MNRLTRISLAYIFFCCAGSFNQTYALADHATEKPQNPLSTDRIFYRFYLLQRLKPSIDLFVAILNEKELQDTGSLEAICSFQQTQIELFTHPLIQKNLLHMCAHRDNKALIGLIETLAYYRYINDDLYVKEVIMLLLVVYENLANIFGKQVTLPLKNTRPTTARFQLHNLVAQNELETDLETLLNTLDQVSEQLEHHYTAHQSTTAFSWKPFTFFITALGASTWLWYINR